MAANLENRADTSIIGKPIDRVDGPLKITGRATYSYEYRGIGETLYGFIVPSTIAKGDITSIDTSAAERVPQVLLVLTHQNVPKQAPPSPFLFAPKVRYYGEPVALVIAQTYEAARHAASLVHVQYSKDSDAAFDLQANKSKAYRPKKVNAGMETDTQEGDFDSAFAQAPVKIDATYVVPYEHNMPMEPHATQAVWEGDELTLYSGQQIPMRAQSIIATTLQVPKEKVRIVTPYIGGGFGSKVPVHAQTILAALGAKAIGQPVKVLQTRQQMFANTNHRPRGIQQMRLGAERDGTLTAIAHEAWMQSTPYLEFVEQVAAFSRTLYAAPNRKHHHRAVALDLPASDIMRAPGEEPGSIAMECGMDELAVALDMDPIELRLKNEPQEDPEHHIPFSSRSLVQCLKDGARRFGWQKRPKKPGTWRDGQWLVGYGVACAAFPAFLQPNSASVRIDRQGKVIVRMAATDIGTGTFTVLTQIAAEELGVPLENVQVEIGDTRFPPAAGSGGSFGAASAAEALHRACLKLKERLAKTATKDWKSVPEDGLEVQAKQDGAPEPPKYSMHSYGAQFVEIGVDVDTAEIRVRRMLGVFACGRILNEKTARSQIIGGMIMGIGAGLTEESVLDVRDGAFVNHDLAEYHVPVNADIPEIEAVFVPEHDEHVNALGIKGLGEVGIVGAAAAIANAVYNATGVRVREFPVTLDKVLPGLPAWRA